MRLLLTTIAPLLFFAIFAHAPFDVQGHRGARGLLPENSIPGFKRALELGVTTLEMDVVIAADSTVVVSHEPWVSQVICRRPDGSPVEAADEFNLYRMTYEEIRLFDCGSRGHPLFPRQTKMPVAKPRLSDVIDAAEAHARTLGRPLPRYNVETKARPEWDGTFTPDPDTFARLVIGELTAGGVLRRSMLQSFDKRTLRAARRSDSSLQTALLVSNDTDVKRDLDSLGFTPTVYSPHYELVDSLLVAEIHAHGMLLIPWTVNSTEDMQRLKRFGVDGLITDYPDIAVSISD